MVLFRRGDDDVWHEPETAAYADEAALQALLAKAPGLIHGVHADQAMVARELSIPGTGFLDLAVIGLDASVTLVECKLRSNPEIRREIVGQILAYASAMAAWTSAELESAWTTTNHTDLVTAAVALGARSGQPVDATQFRAGLDRTLAGGSFRLVLAVDHVTPELRRIVEFLNQRSADTLEVLCIEFDYARDGDVELLIPSTFGAEGADRKAARTAQHTQATFHAALVEHLSAPTAAAVTMLLEHAVNHPTFSHLYWGTGTHPSVTPWFRTPFGEIQPWSMYLGASGKDVIGINFDWIHKRGNGFSAVAVDQFRDNLAGLPGVDAATTDAAASQWAKRPSLSAEKVLSAPGAVDTFTAALDELLATDFVATPSIPTIPPALGRPVSG